MLGPACALRILAQNKTLRDRTRETIQYSSLKQLYVSGALVDEADTSAWRIRTPNRTDVINMLDKTIKAVDEELSEDGLMSIGDAVLPHIEHWDRLVTLLRDRTVAVVTVLPVVLGVSALAILGLVMFTPIYLSVRVYGYFKQLLSRYEDTRILDDLLHEPAQDEGQDKTDPDPHEGGSAPGGHEGEGPSGGHGGESSQAVETMHTEGGGDTQRTTDAASQE